MASPRRRWDLRAPLDASAVVAALLLRAVSTRRLLVVGRRRGSQLAPQTVIIEIVRSATGEEQLNRCPERTNLLRCCGRSSAAGQWTGQLVSARDLSAMKAFTAFSIAFTAS